MGGSDEFMKAVETRRSNYTIENKSPIPNEKIVEIVKASVKHAPSTYNVQSARAVVLFGEDHKKFWGMAAQHFGHVPMPETSKAYVMSRINGYSAAYGTVLWFEDQATLDALGEKNPFVKPMLTTCKQIKEEPPSNIIS